MRRIFASAGVNGIFREASSSAHFIKMHIKHRLSIDPCPILPSLKEAHVPFQGLLCDRSDSLYFDQPKGQPEY